MTRSLVVLGGLLALQLCNAQQPNIVFVLADDLGWNDVGYRNPQMYTPNIDELARHGVRLENFHVNPMCTPTRASFLTGKPAALVGMSNDVLPPWSEAGLSPQESTIADRLKAAGYFTAIIGKWNMGHAKAEYRPLHRGFDYQFGPYAASVEYFKHTYPNTDIHDFFRQDQPYQAEGYLTDLLAQDAQRLIHEHPFDRQPLFLYLPFTAPHGGIEVPQYYVRYVSYIKDQDRRYYAAMVYALDVAVGNTIRSLKARNQWDNTLFVFSSDNGGQAESVWPLRGGKRTLFEGGLRTPTVIHFPEAVGAVPSTGDELFKITDLTATFERAAGISVPPQTDGRDGVDIAAVLGGSQGLPARRVLHVDDRSAAIAFGDLKVVENPDRHQPDGVSDGLNVAIYDIQRDPAEQNDVSAKHPELIGQYEADIKALRARMPPPVVSAADWQTPIRWSTIPADHWWYGNLAKLEYAQRILKRFYPRWKEMLAAGFLGLLLMSMWLWKKRRH